MSKKKKVSPKTIEEPEETYDSLPFAPPDTHYLAERYIVMIPISDERMSDRWQLRLYAEKKLEQRLGDQVQLTSMKVRKPHLLSKTKAKLLKRQPQARLIVTVKF